MKNQMKIDPELYIQERWKCSTVTLDGEKYDCEKLFCTDADRVAYECGTDFLDVAESNILFLRRQRDGYRRLFLTDYWNSCDGFPFLESERKHFLFLTSVVHPEGFYALEFFPPAYVIDDIERQMSELRLLL